MILRNILCFSFKENININKTEFIVFIEIIFLRKVYFVTKKEIV